MVIKEKTTVTLKSSAHCPTHSLANVSVRDLLFAIDEPLERGGSNTGPTPTDAALAALVGCTNVIAHKCASSLGIEIGELSIAAECDFDRRGVTLKEAVKVPFQRIILNIESSGSATDAQLIELSAEVAKYCPLSQLFRNAGTVIEERWHTT